MGSTLALSCMLSHFGGFAGDLRHTVAGVTEIRGEEITSLVALSRLNRILC